MILHNWFETLEDKIIIEDRKEINETILSKIPLEDQVHITEENMKTLLSIFTSNPKHDSSHISGEDGTRKKAALWYIQQAVLENKINGSTQEEITESLQ